MIASSESRKAVTVTARWSLPGMRRTRCIMRRSRSAGASEGVRAGAGVMSWARVTCEFVPVTRIMMGEMMALRTMMPMACMMRTVCMMPMSVMGEVVAVRPVTTRQRVRELIPAAMMATGVPMVAMMAAAMVREVMLAAVMAMMCYVTMSTMMPVPVVGKVMAMMTVVASMGEMAMVRSM